MIELLVGSVVSTAEDVSSFALAVAAIVAPIIAGILMIGLIVAAVVLWRRARVRRHAVRRAQS